MSGKLSMWQRLCGTPDVASCLHVTRVLQSYLDGNVDNLTARRVARHLELCRRCGLEAQTYAKIKESLARRGAPEVNPAAVARLRAFGAGLADQGQTDRDAGPAAPDER